MSYSIGYILIGLVAGLASGCFGIGGGVIIVPSLMLFFRMPYPVAVGTSLALILPISIAGSLFNYKSGTIDTTALIYCSIAGILGALLGSLLISHIPPLYARRAFACFLIYAAWMLWMKK